MSARQNPIDDPELNGRMQKALIKENRGLPGISFQCESKRNCAHVVIHDGRGNGSGITLSPQGVVHHVTGLLSGLLPPHSVLGWHMSPELPDDETRVLFAAGDDVEVGHHEGGQWITTEGHLFGNADVYAWAHLPAPPDLPAKGGAS